MAPDIREQLRRAARDPREELDPAARRRRVGQLRRRRAGAAVAMVALVVLLVPLGQAGLERLPWPAGVVDRPAAPAATTSVPPTTVSAPTTTIPPRRAVRPAPLGTPEQAFRALARLPRGWSELPTPPEAREDAVSVWIGNGLLFWGGASRGRGPGRRLGVRPGRTEMASGHPGPAGREVGGRRGLARPGGARLGRVRPGGQVQSSGVPTR